MTSVTVRKDRRMIAAELVASLRLEAWEQDALVRLRRETLVRIATTTIPGFTTHVTLHTLPRHHDDDAQ